VYQEPTGNRIVRKAPTYSLLDGYFALMGGLVIDNPQIAKKFPNLPNSRCLTITPRGVEVLASRNHFLKVPDKRIHDRSKADVLAKGLICFQVLWMVILVSFTVNNNFKISRF
jgi:hypothetical protein